jgi:phosphoglycerol transferase
MSLYGLALFFNQMAINARKLVYYPVILVVLVLAIMDQTPFHLITRNFKTSSNTATSVTQLTARMELLLGQNALVYQLPFLSYPHTPVTNLMISHQHLAGYVFSKTLKWSWPALSTDTVYMNRSLAKLDSNGFIRNLAVLGFDSIWIDRRAYKDKGEGLSRQLQIEGVIPLVSNETIIVLDMRKAKYKFQNQYSAEQKSAMRDRLIGYGEKPGKPAQLVSGQTISFTKSGYSNDFIGEGWSGQESGFRWTEGHRAEINIYLKNYDGHDVVIVMDAGAFVLGSHEQPLEISANGKVVGKFLFTAKKSRQKIRVVIPDGLIREKDNYIQLILAMSNPVSPYELGLSKDERILGIQVRSLQILPKNENP